MNSINFEDYVHSIVRNFQLKGLPITQSLINYINSIIDKAYYITSIEDTSTGLKINYDFVCDRLSLFVNKVIKSVKNYAKRTYKKIRNKVRANFSHTYNFVRVVVNTFSIENLAMIRPLRK